MLEQVEASPKHQVRKQGPGLHGRSLMLTLIGSLGSSREPL